MSFTALISILMCLSFVGIQAGAVTKRVQDIDYNGAAEGLGSSFSRTFNTSQDMLNLATSASEGAGRLKGKGAYCYRAVKQIIADAFGKNKECVKAALAKGAPTSGRSAYEAGDALVRNGWVQDSSQCKTPGAIRVYRGNKAKGFKAQGGDIHGHVEVVGDEGMYHSFFSSTMPIDESMDPGRRVLTGCYVPDHERIKNSDIGKCPDSSKRYKTTRPDSSKHLKKKGSQ